MKIIDFVSKIGCFDLQFRRDVKYNRPNKPVYYAWRAQFIVVGNSNNENLLRGIQNTLDCGRLHFVSGHKIRYSVQDVDNLYNKVLPFFKSCSLSRKKKQDFEWWAEAIEILYQNKGKTIRAWHKDDCLRIIEIQKIMQKHKSKRSPALKWLSIAESIAHTLA